MRVDLDYLYSRLGKNVTQETARQVIATEGDLQQQNEAFGLPPENDRFYPYQKPDGAWYIGIGNRIGFEDEMSVVDKQRLSRWQSQGMPQHHAYARLANDLQAANKTARKLERRNKVAAPPEEFTQAMTHALYVGDESELPEVMWTEAKVGNFPAAANAMADSPIADRNPSIAASIATGIAINQPIDETRFANKGTQVNPYVPPAKVVGEPTYTGKFERDLSVPLTVQSNNPGALNEGLFSRRYGATQAHEGTTGNRTAIFESRAHGAAALGDLILNRKGLTVREYITGGPNLPPERSYSGGQNYDSYIASLESNGVNVDDVVDGSPAQMRTLLNAHIKSEDSRAEPLSEDDFDTAMALLADRAPAATDAIREYSGTVGVPALRPPDSVAQADSPSFSPEVTFSGGGGSGSSGGGNDAELVVLDADSGGTGDLRPEQQPRQEVNLEDLQVGQPTTNNTSGGLFPGIAPNIAPNIGGEELSAEDREAIRVAGLARPFAAPESLEFNEQTGGEIPNIPSFDGNTSGPIVPPRDQFTNSPQLAIQRLNERLLGGGQVGGPEAEPVQPVNNLNPEQQARLDQLDAINGITSNSNLPPENRVSSQALGPQSPSFDAANLGPVASDAAVQQAQLADTSPAYLPSINDNSSAVGPTQPVVPGDADFVGPTVPGPQEVYDQLQQEQIDRLREFAPVINERAGEILQEDLQDTREFAQGRANDFRNDGQALQQSALSGVRAGNAFENIDRAGSVEATQATGRFGLPAQIRGIAAGTTQPSARALQNFQKSQDQLNQANRTLAKVQGIVDGTGDPRDVQIALAQAAEEARKEQNIINAYNGDPLVSRSSALTDEAFANAQEQTEFFSSRQRMTEILRQQFGLGQELEGQGAAQEDAIAGTQRLSEELSSFMQAGGSFNRNLLESDFGSSINSILNQYFGERREGETFRTRSGDR